MLLRPAQADFSRVAGPLRVQTFRLLPLTVALARFVSLVTLLFATGTARREGLEDSLPTAEISLLKLVFFSHSQQHGFEVVPARPSALGE
jgi:hypothetical protein